MPNGCGPAPNVIIICELRGSASGVTLRAFCSAAVPEVAKVRKLAAKYQINRAKEQAQQGRIEFLPLEWYGPIHVEVGIGNRLKNVTLKSVSHLRDFANFALADVMVYLDDQWRERIHEELLKKMGQLWQLFSARTPSYSGEVAVIGHSLGSVIMFDLIQKGLEKFPHGLHSSPSKDMPQGSSKTMLCTPAKATVGTPGSFDKKGVKLLKEHMARGNVVALAKGKEGAHEHPLPRCLFAVGSPLGMFLSIRLSQKAQRASRYFRGLDVRWPPASAGQGWRFFNVFHPDDPIAYRIEPLLNPAYTNMSPRVVPHRGGLRWNHQIATFWSSVSTRPLRNPCGAFTHHEPMMHCQVEEWR
ncbi:Ddhd2 [Symbiodinium pilosum]|uniref:Ddhd2 protein n=1 Tax=Symbiodinium pilosum TaxID=2952 RepID=A0A812W9T9_SYMPI|nr:Ddhd2 [Symbiodinium pilosum]